MQDLEAIYSHTFEDYNKRMNDRPRTFISKSDMVSSEPAVMDWGVDNQEMRNRTTRKKLV